MMETPHNRTGFESRSRLLAKLVRVLLAREKFETLGDLTEALKVACARLRIRWTPDDITAAYRLIDSNRPLPGTPQPPRRQVEVISPVTDETRPLSRDEATDLYRRLGVALVREHGRRRA